MYLCKHMLTRIDALATYIRLLNLRLQLYGIKDDDSRIECFGLLAIEVSVLGINCYQQNMIYFKFYKIALMNRVSSLIQSHKQQGCMTNTFVDGMDWAFDQSRMLVIVGCSRMGQITISSQDGKQRKPHSESYAALLFLQLWSTESFLCMGQ